MTASSAASHRPEDVARPDSGGAPRWALLLAPALVFLALHARSLPYEFVWVDESEIVQGAIFRPLDELPRAFVEPPWKLDDQLSGLQAYYRPLHVVVANLVHHSAGDRPE